MSSADDPARIEVDVLVLGASFAGIEVVYQLHRLAADAPPRIAVIDRDGAHGYLPLVQERLLCTIDESGSTLATSRYIDGLPKTRFIAGEIVGVDLQTQTATLADGARVRGKVLVIAVGSVLTPPTGLPGGEHLLAHKSPQQYEALKAALGRACAREDAEPRIVVVGGGISGVELAGELAATATRDRRPWPGKPKVTLVASTDSLVPILHRRVGVRAKAALEEQGVDVRLATRLVAASEDAVEVERAGARERLPCALAVWVGGIAPAPMVASLAVEHTKGGWIAVGPTLQCFPVGGGPPTVLACGDAVRVVGGQGEWPTMQRAIECIWQAKVIARNALVLLEAKPGESPPLRPHRLRRRFAYGVSLGRRSLVVWGWLCVDVRGINHGFRRWLMRQYFARYPALASPRG